MRGTLLSKTYQRALRRGYPALLWVFIPCLLSPIKAPAALPPIEAKTYNLTPKRTSTSKRVVLFAAPTEGIPVDRKIFLLRRDGQNTMAFRVVKAYPDRNEFAATRVREYREIKELELSVEYRAYEKVGDLAPLPSAEEQAKDDLDLQELEAPAPPAAAPAPPPTAEVTPADGELDADLDGPPAAPEVAEGPAEEPSEDLTDMPEIPSSLMLREDPVYDPDLNALGGEFAYLRSFRGFYFSAGGLRYSYTFSRNLPLGGAPQTSWSLDAGAYLYRVSNYVATALDDTSTDEDSFSLLPLAASVRYTVNYSADLGVFAYAGLMYTFIAGSFLGSPDDPDAVSLFNSAAAELGTLTPMGGIGMLYRFGPRWNLRVDAGWDRIAMSVMLRF